MPGLCHLDIGDALYIDHKITPPEAYFFRIYEFF